MLSKKNTSEIFAVFSSILTSLIFVIRLSLAAFQIPIPPTEPTHERILFEKEEIKISKPKLGL